MAIDKGVTVEYGGSVITTMAGTSDGECTLLTGGKFVDEDIYLSYKPLDVNETRTVTPTKSTQNITPLTADGLAKVTVNPIPSSYIIPEGLLTITENDSYDVTELEQVIVNIPIQKCYISNSSPTLSIGNVGDLYLVRSS